MRIAIVIVVVLALTASQSVLAQDIVHALPAQASTSTSGNYYPFGGTDGWTPYALFIYTNIPSFSVAAGGIVGFCSDATNQQPNNVDIRRTIYFGRAVTTANGGKLKPNTNQGTVTIEGMTKVVADGTASGRGDLTYGTFDIEFTLTSDYTFDAGNGAGFVIGFEYEGSTNDDRSYQFPIIGGTSSDPSGNFYRRAFRRNALNGSLNNGGTGASYISSFRIRGTDNVDPTAEDACNCDRFVAGAGCGAAKASSNEKCVCLSFSEQETACDPANLVDTVPCED